MTPRIRTPRLVLATALALTAAATAFVAVAGRQRDAARFETAVRGAEDEIRNRLGAHVALLEGAQAFFGGSDTVTARDFRRYVGAANVQERYPGIRGIGFSRRLAPAETATVFGARRRDGLADFRMEPATPRQELHVIVYLEPLDARNRAAMGYDMYTEPVRRAAMAAARDRGTAVMSGRVRLRQELSGAGQPGFLIYVPVYRGGERPTTVEARRAALLGFVYAPFRTGELFAALFGAGEFVAPGVAFRIWDGEVGDTAQLMYASHRAGSATFGPGGRTRPLRVADRTWQVEYAPLAVRDPLGTGALTAATAIIGLLVSLVLWRLTVREDAARRAAQRSEAVRSRFFAAMSHELRTPINAILGYNDLVLAEVYGPLPEAQRDAVERGQRAARHLLELVNDVLDLSKIEAGKIDIVAEAVDVPTLLDDLMTTVVPMAEARGCALERGGTACPASLETDPRRVRQVLLNLLSNATKFGAGKPVTLRCSARDDGWASFEVVDRGPGIAPEDVPRVWEEFVQLGHAAEGGTGLGLPISRRLAELLGGRLELESRPGQGSTFRLLLPPRIIRA